MPVTTLPLALTAGTIAFLIANTTSASLVSITLALNGPNTIAYRWKYRIVGVPTWTIAAGQTGINAILSGLLPETSYEAVREALSEAGVGQEIIPTPVIIFTTEAAVPPPTEVVGLTNDEHDKLLRAAGLTGENQVCRDFTYDERDNLLSFRIRLYDTAAHALTDNGVTGLIASFLTSNTLDVQDRVTKTTTLKE